MSEETVTISRSLLEKLEWCASTGRGDPECPACGGTLYPLPGITWTRTHLMMGHKPECKIAIALGRDMPNYYTEADKAEAK